MSEQRGLGAVEVSSTIELRCMNSSMS